MTVGQGKLDSSAAAAGAEENPGVETPESARARRVKRVVMLVEDDPMIRIPIVTALQRKGWAVVSTADGREAVEAFVARKDEIGVVVLDLVMPRKDGLATFHELRAVDATLPVILTSGLTDDARVVTLLSLGVREFLPKPYAVDDLLRALERALA